MAGDWIKWCKGLHRKREVLGIADILGITPAHAAGLCMIFWEWLDDNIADKDIDSEGNAHVTLGPLQHQFVDRLVGADGFAAALAAVGWLHVRNGSLTVPNFTRHNGQTGKTRALTAERVAAYRQRASPNPKCNENVTLAALQNRYQRREEKRRKEKISPAITGDKTRSCATGPPVDIDMERACTLDSQKLLDLLGPEWQQALQERNQAGKNWLEVLQDWFLLRARYGKIPLDLTQEAFEQCRYLGDPQLALALLTDAVGNHWRSITADMIAQYKTLLQQSQPAKSSIFALYDSLPGETP